MFRVVQKKCSCKKEIGLTAVLTTVLVLTAAAVVGVVGAVKEYPEETEELKDNLRNKVKDLSDKFVEFETKLEEKVKGVIGVEAEKVAKSKEVK